MGPQTSAWISWSSEEARHVLCLEKVSLCCFPTRHVVQISLGGFKDGRPVTICLLASVQRPLKLRCPNRLCHKCISVSKISAVCRQWECSEAVK